MRFLRLRSNTDVFRDHDARAPLKRSEKKTVNYYMLNNFVVNFNNLCLEMTFKIVPIWVKCRQPIKMRIQTLIA